MSRIDLEKRQRWQERIYAWEQSGLSGARWCKENGAPYCQFEYWKKQLHRTPKKELREGFTELTAPVDEPAETRVEICLGGVTIRVDSRFNEGTLSRVLQLLGRLS